MNKKHISVIFFFLISGASLLQAHPHLFLDSRVTVVFQDDRPAGVEIEWTFDRMYSASIMQSVDWDQSGSFSTSEQQDAYQGYFSNLKNYDFFLILHRDGRELPKVVPADISRFSAKIDSNRQVVYRFFVALPAMPSASDSATHTLTVSCFDPTCYSAFRFQDENPVDISGFSRERCRWTVGENRERPYYYDPLAGTSETFDSSVYKQGMMVMYPHEVQFVYD